MTAKKPRTTTINGHKFEAVDTVPPALAGRGHKSTFLNDTLAAMDQMKVNALRIPVDVLVPRIYEMNKKAREQKIPIRFTARNVDRITQKGTIYAERVK